MQRYLKILQEVAQIGNFCIKGKCWTWLGTSLRSGELRPIHVCSVNCCGPEIEICSRRKAIECAPFQLHVAKLQEWPEHSMCPLHCWDLGSQHQTTWLMHARSVGLAVLCFASTLSKRERSTTGLAWWQPWYGQLQASSAPIFAQHYVLTVGKYCTFSFCQCGKSSTLWHNIVTLFVAQFSSTLLLPN